MIVLLSHILSLPARSQSIIAGSMGVTVLILIGSLSASILNGVLTEVEAIQGHRVAVGKFQASYALMKSVVESDARLSETLTNAVLTGDSDAVASAAVQSWFSSIAETEGLEINSIGTATTLTVGSIRMIGIQVNLSGPYDSLVRVVNLVENSSPKLFLTRMDLFSPADSVEEGALFSLINANLTVMGVPRRLDNEGLAK